MMSQPLFKWFSKTRACREGNQMWQNINTGEGYMNAPHTILATNQKI